MSNVAARSTTGCLACKTKRKKCDETKPQCLRCQKSRIECPGYTYVQRPNKPTQKPRTLPAPRTRVGRPRDRTRQSTSIDIEELHSQSQGQSPGSSVALGTSMADAETSPEVIDTSNPWVFLSSFSGSLQHPSTDFLALSGHELVATNPDPVLLPQATSDLMPMTSGQVTLLEALFSLGQPPDPVAQHPCANTSTRPASDWSPPSSSSQDDVEILEDEDPEGVVTVICRAPLPDKSVESNTLPFLLQGYATWIRRMAFEPLKMAHIARDFVFRHFADRDVSRWTLTLLANIGSRIGSVGFTEHDPMLAALHTTVRRRLDTVKSGHNSAELVKALDFALETMIIHIFVSPFSDVVTLQQEAAPIFRRLCPGPPNAAIDLSLLLHHPLVCLRKYAHFDVFFNVVMDLPTLFGYDVTSPGDQNLSLDEPMATIQSETNLRWMHGTPNHLTILFARLKSMRQNGLTPDLETVLSIEREIRELKPFSGSSSESYMVIVRFVVQECWRQAAFVYLYMAVCGDSSETTRVKETFKRFKKLLQQTKPGRLPDEFLGMVLMLIAPAAQRIRDREIIRQRLLGLHSLGRTFRANNSLITVLEDYWARADAERRPIMWSDVTVSRMRVLGV